MPRLYNATGQGFNLSRFGRTLQWQCTQGHGYFQTFVLCLAERGFVHKMGWADLKQIGSKRQLFCAGRGAALDDQPHLRSRHRVPGLFRSELDVFRHTLRPTSTVERVEHVLAGARRCVYRITPV